MDLYDEAIKDEAFLEILKELKIDYDLEYYGNIERLWKVYKATLAKCKGAC